MNNLGICYATGTGTKPSKEKAIEWFEKASATGDGEGLCNLGYMYQAGVIVERNDSIALVYYRKSAAMGYELAAHRVDSLLKLRVKTSE